MTPESKCDDLITRFGDKAIDVAQEVKDSTDAARSPYWEHVINLIKVERLKRVIKTIRPNKMPPAAFRYEY